MPETPTQASYFDVARRQRAHRALLPKPVPEALIEQILETATFAPSARNSQPWHFVVVQDAEVRQSIADGARAAWLGFAREATANEDGALFRDVDRWAMSGLAEAPVIIVLCGDTTRLPLEQMGSSIYPAAQNVLLAANALGLGSLLSSLPIHAPDRSLAKILSLPSHIVPLATLPIGYPARKLGPPRREPVAEHASRDRFGTPW
jgi:nitroreductase